MDSDLVGRKSLGQHWLHDEASLNAIYSSINVNASDTILEIGPGLGSLTTKLVSHSKKVVAVELDEEIIEHLKKTLKASNLEVIQGNILKFDLTTLPKDFKVIANIPYYLTSNLLRTLCESTNPFSEAALLVQKEVAQRVAAEPGKMSLLSVSVQFYCNVQLGQVVASDKFTPPPKVDSQVLVLTRREKPLFNGLDTKQFFRLVKAGFSQRRKTILNSLSGGLRIDRERASDIILKAGLDANTRPQTLSLEDWYELFQAING